jgi:hypothetical protein
MKKTIRRRTEITIETIEITTVRCGRAAVSGEVPVSDSALEPTHILIGYREVGAGEVQTWREEVVERGETGDRRQETKDQEPTAKS